MKLSNYFLSLFLFIATPLAAVTYRGQVVDRDGHPVAGVNIVGNRSEVNAITDDDGLFEITADNVKYLTFSHVSYQPQLVNLTGKENTLQKIILEATVYPGQNVRVTAMRAISRLTPVAFADITDDDIARDYTLEDFPILLETTPNMYTSSFTGGLAGASDYKIRGFDSKRIGVYINGIPLNDPEDRFTYFYDLADFAAEVADIQVQRGVGNSLYGDATFGGSINIASAGLERARKISLSTGYGAFMAGDEIVSEMNKQSVEFSSGLIDGRWSLAGRYSKMYSGGYRENAWYDGWAYFLSLSRLDDNMTTVINLYGGPMKAHLAFDGVGRSKLSENRRYNPAWYENEIDDFNQPHYELHNTYRISEGLTLKNTLYYIRGKGYYEQYKDDRDIYEYNIGTDELADPGLTEINLVRQKWVAKNQVGWNPRLDWEHHRGTASFGASVYYFDSEHWGQVIWAENVKNNLNPRHRYYEYFGTKYSASVYALEYYSLSEKIRLMGNLQLRYLKYDFDQARLGALPGHQYNIDWVFLSPRAGVTYLLDESTDLYVSVAVASREPADVTIYDAEDVAAFPQLEIESFNVSGLSDTMYNFGGPLVDPERVYNIEVGANYRRDNYRAGLNLYWMEFKSEIIPSGGVDDDGRPRIGNADRSVHAGVELDGAVRLFDYLTVEANASASYNRLKKYLVYNDADWDGVAEDTIDYADHPTPGFPEFIANLTLDYKRDPIRLVYRLRGIGKQFIENSANEDLAIGKYMVSSVSASYRLGRPADLGRFTLSARVENLFNEKYEMSGYAYEWGGTLYGEYYPAAERSFFVQLKWDLE